ncbi:MAG: hypothetical protein GXO36_07280 [Chloroflexi bacterium]|nr:hypothetical protein [Chloroflexota bacterium]
MSAWKPRVKAWLAHWPWAPALYWHLRGRPDHVGGLRLAQVRRRLPEWTEAVAAHTRASRPPKGKRLLIVAPLHLWLAHAVPMGLTLAAMGHDVHLAYWPYRDWFTPLDPFALRQQDAYAWHVLQKARPWLRPISLVRTRPAPVPSTWEPWIEHVTQIDARYTLMREDVPAEARIVAFRRARNRSAAGVLRAVMTRLQPDRVLVPNGLVLEFGVAYHVARALGIPVTTYEFGPEPERIWLDPEEPVVYLNTRALWAAWRDRPWPPGAREKIQALFDEVWNARAGQYAARRWQNVPMQGADTVRQQLHLDERPVVLLAPNVFGDSVMLDHAIFSQGMADWLRRTLRFLAERPQVQVVIRVHPSEKHLPPKALRVTEVVREVLPTLPEHMRLVEAEDPVNTTDLVRLAIGTLVYASTVGLEAALLGRPAIVAARAYYRGHGFTWDPESWDAYWRVLETLLQEPETLRPSPAQVEDAWKFAYAFFFHWLRPFPWPLPGMAQHWDRWPLAQVLGHEGERFRATFEALAGAPIRWTD